MSRNYAVGEQTKHQIFTESKKLFYKKGFNETTYDDICRVAKVNRALIPYYFKNKQNLGYMVYRDIYMDFKEELDRCMEPKQFPADLSTFIQTFAYYRLLKSRELSRFALQIMNSDASIDATLVGGEKKFITEISSDKKFSIEELETLANFDYSIEKEIHRLIYMHPESIDPDRLCSTELSMIMGYAGHSKKKINEMMKQSVNFLDSLSMTVKNGFVISITKNPA